ncbi:MAG: hypothetical protein ACYC35_06725 [Pirellulales bacterium]
MPPQSLLAPATPDGLPAPFWFVDLFKVLGFTLHAVPMNLWYAGVVLAMLAGCCGGEHARRAAARLMKQMPIVVAVGVNLGIVPLLFLQVGYYRFFYPATILMAWPWMAVIGLLILAYYGVYLYAAGLRREAGLPWYARAAGWVSAASFLLIGFLFANALSLMTNLGAWPALWEATSVAGAPLGIALNTGSASFWPRWLLMFGLALTTTAAWLAVDAAWLAWREDAEYRRWANRVAPLVYTAGMIWFAAAGSWYVFGTWPPELRAKMFAPGLLPMTVMTAIAPGLPWLLLIARRQGAGGRLSAAAVGLAQFGVLAVNAGSRQVVQKAELSRFTAIGADPVHVQWSPLILFLVLFVAGLGVVLWMVGKVVAVERAAG